MMKPIIGLVAAMPEEIAPFLKRHPGTVRQRVGGRPFYRIETPYCVVHLIEAGMGPANADAATRQLLDLGRPHLLGSVGFCGAITAQLAVGDLVAADIAYLLDRQHLFPQSGIDHSATERAMDLLHRHLQAPGITSYLGAFFTTPVSITKKKVGEMIPARTTVSVLEMETALVAKIADAEQIPFLGLRSVSDASDEELAFDITDFTDDSLRIRPTKVALSIIKRPGLIPQLIRLARNARIAGNSLALAMTILTENYYA